MGKKQTVAFFEGDSETPVLDLLGEGRDTCGMRWWRRWRDTSHKKNRGIYPLLVVEGDKLHFLHISLYLFGLLFFFMVEKKIGLWVRINIILDAYLILNAHKTPY